MTLPYDVTRCEGDGCDRRDTCERYLIMWGAPYSKTVAMVNSMSSARKLCKTPEYELYIPDADESA